MSKAICLSLAGIDKPGRGFIREEHQMDVLDRQTYAQKIEPTYGMLRQIVAGTPNAYATFPGRSMCRGEKTARSMSTVNISIATSTISGAIFRSRLIANFPTILESRRRCGRSILAAQINSRDLRPSRSCAASLLPRNTG